MKDIINLNAKETNIAIVWAILFIVGLGIHLIFPTINSVHLVMCGFVVLCVAHCFWITDLFAPIKKRLPFVMMLFVVLGWLVRIGLWLYFASFMTIMFLFKQYSSSFLFDILLWLNLIVVVILGLAMLYSVVRVKIKAMKAHLSFPISIGYQNIPYMDKSIHFVIPILMIFMVFYVLIMNLYISVLEIPD